MSRQIRHKCIFCETEGQLTKEHLFGKWLRKYFPRDARTSRRRAEITWPDVIGPAPATDSRRIQQGHIGSMQLRRVCKPCNGGWMKALEDRIEPALTCLMNGDQGHLSTEAQALLATWAVKTVMVCEYMGHFPPETPQHERSFLREQQKPPHNWFVWISAYEGTIWRELSIYQMRAGFSSTRLEKGSDAPYFGHSTCFGVGRLLFCVLHGSAPDLWRTFATREAEGFIQIWPMQNRSILWPPQAWMTDEDANQIANFFSTCGLYDTSQSPGHGWKFRH